MNSPIWRQLLRASRTLLSFFAVVCLTNGTFNAYANVPNTSFPVRPLPFPAPQQPSEPASPWWQSLLTLFDAQPEPAGEMIWSPSALLPAPPPLCTVEPIPAIEDEEAIAFENGQGVDSAVNLGGLTPATLGALEKFEQTVTLVGGELTITSAYRPPTYQEHLTAVWDKWQEVRDIQNPACQPLKASVEAEFTKHTLLETQRPVALSDHTLGVGFDAYVVLPPAAHYRKMPVDIDKLAKLCRLRRPDRLNDHVHFRLAL